MPGFSPVLLCGVCVCSLMKLVVPEVHCCHQRNSAVYQLHGEVGPDCTVIWLSRDGRMIVDDSGNVDPNTAVSYEHSELTMKSPDSDVLVRMDCLTTGEHSVGCAGQCNSEKADFLTEEDRFSPLIIILLSLGPFVLLLFLSIVGVVVYKRRHGSHDCENANTTNNAEDHHSFELQPLQ